MKKIICFSISLFIFVINSHSQLSFTMNASTCVNIAVQATASSGSISSPSYTWSSSPAGVIFSNTTTASTVLTFTAAGNYTVVASVTSGTVISYAQNTIVVIALPSPIGIANPSIVCPGYSSTITAFGANSYTWIGASAGFSGSIANQSSISVGYVSSATTYTLIGSNGGACTIQTTALIMPSPPLNIVATANTYTTCIQENSNKLSKPVMLTASGANNYTWFDASGIILPLPFPFPIATTVRPSATTQYTVLGNTSVCSGSAVITITVIPQFTIAVVPIQATICAGDAITLSLTQTGQPSFGPYTYSWTEQDELITTLNSVLSQTVLASPLIKRTYSLEIRDGNSCVSAPTSLTIDVSSCTEIGENIKFKPLHVFPNPFDKELFLQNNSTNLNIEIKDGLGQLILSKEINSQEAVDLIKTEKLSPGIYFLQIYTKHVKVQSFKIIKN